MRSKCTMLLPVLLAGALLPAARAGATPSRPRLQQGAIAHACLAAARKALGPRAEVLKCGSLTGRGKLEVVAAVRLQRFRTDADGTPVSKLAILRKQPGASGWTCEFGADEDGTRNPAGYVGIEFIDDSFQYTGYRALLSARRSDGARDFTIYLYDLSPRGHNEGIPVEVSWNAAVGRFQEIDYGEGNVFVPEIKNPPHIRTRKPR